MLLIDRFLVSAADLRAGYAIATGQREHNRRCLHQDRVQHADQFHGLHTSWCVLFPYTEKQVEYLQDAGENGGIVRIRWKGLRDEGNLRNCVRAIRWQTRLAGTVVASLL